MDAQLGISLVLTILVTTLLVRGWNWIRRAKTTHPELYRRRYTIRAWLILLLHFCEI
jgi:hypothetical protein